MVGPGRVDRILKDAGSWRAANMRADQSWLIRLSDAHQAEIRAAVARSAARGEAIEGISRESFDLPRLGPVLDGVRRDVMHGRGLAVLRGLELAGLARGALVRAFFGIGSHLGTARPQNAAGHLLGHVYDLGEDASDPATRVYRTAARQRFHVDSCDIVGLLCLRKPRSGGASLLCSSLAVVEELAATRPDLLAVLRRPFVYDRKNEVPEGKSPHYEIPIVHEWRGRTSVYFARDFIEAAQRRFPDVARLTSEQVEALDAVERLAESPALRLELDFEPGDIQLVHNHVVLHARDAYEDGPAPDEKRHLLRLWLSAHDPRPLPPVFAERYGPLVEGRPRGGIAVPGAVPRIPMEPE